MWSPALVQLRPGSQITLSRSEKNKPLHTGPTPGPLSRIPCPCPASGVISFWLHRESSWVAASPGLWIWQVGLSASMCNTFQRPCRLCQHLCTGGLGAPESAKERTLGWGKGAPNLGLEPAWLCTAAALMKVRIQVVGVHLAETKRLGAEAGQQGWCPWGTWWVQENVHPATSSK